MLLPHFVSGTLCSPPECLGINSLFWHTENFAASKIVELDSSKPKLQTKAVRKKAFHVCK